MADGEQDGPDSPRHIEHSPLPTVQCFCLELTPQPNFEPEKMKRHSDERESAHLIAFSIFWI